MIPVPVVTSTGCAVMERQAVWWGARLLPAFLSIVCAAESLAVQLHPQGSEGLCGGSSR